MIHVQHVTWQSTVVRVQARCSPECQRWQRYLCMRITSDFQGQPVSMVTSINTAHLFTLFRRFVTAQICIVA